MDVDPLLSRWLEAGLLDEATAERVRGFEKARSGETARPGLLEVVVYLAAAVIGVGVLVLIATNWGHLPTAVRVGTAGLGASIALLAGVVLRGSAHGGLRRGSQATWLLAEALTGATAAIVARESGAGAEVVILVAALVTLPTALLLWAHSKTHVQLLGVAGACWLVALAAAVMMAEHGNENLVPLTLGLTILSLSLAGIILLELAVLVPVSSGRLLTGLGTVAGVFFCGVGQGPGAGEAVAFAVAAALITLSLKRGVFAYMAVGVVAVFIGLVTVTLRHVHDPTAAALALIAIGLVMLGGIVALERWRPWRGVRRPGSGPPHLSTPA